MLEGALLELANAAAPYQGEAVAAKVLASESAWRKFQRICEAQGGLRAPPASRQQRPVLAGQSGRIHAIDNRKIAKLAKLAGAPDEKAAGVDLRVRVGDVVEKGQLCIPSTLPRRANWPTPLTMRLQTATSSRFVNRHDRLTPSKS